MEEGILFFTHPNFSNFLHIYSLTITVVLQTPNLSVVWVGERYSLCRLLQTDASDHERKKWSILVLYEQKALQGHKWLYKKSPKIAAPAKVC